MFFRSSATDTVFRADLRAQPVFVVFCALPAFSLLNQYSAYFLFFGPHENKQMLMHDAAVAARTTKRRVIRSPARRTGGRCRLALSGEQRGAMGSGCSASLSNTATLSFTRHARRQHLNSREIAPKGGEKFAATRRIQPGSNTACEACYRRFPGRRHKKTQPLRVGLDRGVRRLRSRVRKLSTASSPLGPAFS